MTSKKPQPQPQSTLHAQAPIETPPPAMPAKRTPTRLGGTLWENYQIRWTFVSRVYASVPADPDVIRAWLESRQPEVRPADARSIDETQEEVIASLANAEGEPPMEQLMLVFQYADFEGQRAIAFRHDTIRAHIKDCARVLSAQFISRIPMERAFSTRVTNGVYLDPTQPWTALRRPDGQMITKPDGAEDRFVHVRGRSALKRLEYIEPPVVVTFTLKVLGKSIAVSDFDYLFSYAGVHGYGGERSRDGGKYMYEILDANEGS